MINLCSWELTNLHIVDQCFNTAPRLSISETEIWFRGFSLTSQPVFGRGLKEAVGLKSWELQLPNS